MLAKVRIWGSLSLIALVTGMLCACGSPAPEVPPTSDVSSVPSDSVEEVPVTSAAADRIDVVYFHRTQRCTGCVYAETGTRYTLENHFAEELESGKIVFKTIDLGDKANTTTVEHYGAYTSSLFINNIREGTDHIEEVSEIWFVLGNDEEFVEVVKSKIEESLKQVR